MNLVSIHDVDEELTKPIDRVYWERDLRLSRFDATIALSEDADERRAAVDKAFTNRRVLIVCLESLGLPTKGRIDQLQKRLSAQGERAIPLLLVARFAPYKMSAAVSDIAESVLDEGTLESCQLDNGHYDRLALLLRLYLAEPASLIRVRGLNAWHRRGAAPMVLAKDPPIPDFPLDDFLVAERITQALRNAPMASDTQLLFEMTVPRGDGSHLLFLRRNHRPAYLWSDDGRDIRHGNEEEIIVLHFEDNARRVRISSSTSEQPRRVANRIASAYFDTECSYIDAEAEVERAQIENLLAALTDPEDQRLPLVELVVKNCPLAGRDRFTLSDDDGGDIIASLDDFESRVGSLFGHIDDVVRIKVRFEKKRVSLFFPRRDGSRTVEFGDGRLDNNQVGRFIAFVEQEFHLTVRSTERKASRR